MGLLVETLANTVVKIRLISFKINISRRTLGKELMHILVPIELNPKGTTLLVMQGYMMTTLCQHGVPHEHNRRHTLAT